jgi:hypothetical protein
MTPFSAVPVDLTRSPRHLNGWNMALSVRSPLATE